MQIDEQTLMNVLQSAKKVVLLEPDYKAKFMPLGLAKISTLVKSSGGEVCYQRKYLPQGEDLVCITSLFTYESQEVIDAIQQVLFLNPMVKIIVGGIYATLMSEGLELQFGKRIYIYKGYSKKLDMISPDYELNNNPELNSYKCSVVFTTRGCKNACAYCAVKRLEPDSWVNPGWKSHVSDSLPYAMVCDNNLTAFPKEHISDVIGYLKEKNKKVCFDNGLDCKMMTPELAKEFATLKYYKTGMRLAFDRIDEKGVFQNAIKMLLDAGIKKNDFLIYVLYNFNDTPQEAEYRFNECIKLGVRPYPQCYVPLNNLTRESKFVGKHWTAALKRNFRVFYMFAGLYNKSSLEDWLKKGDDKGKPMNQGDWDKYYFKKG